MTRFCSRCGSEDLIVYTMGHMEADYSGEIGFCPVCDRDVPLDEDLLAEIQRERGIK